MCFREHLFKSIEVLQANPNAALVISGGQTKECCEPMLEARSYFKLGCAIMPTTMKELEQRVHLEEFARDSFENVLFLFCRFYELYGHYPLSVTIVGFEFKRKRFIEQHMELALKYPSSRTAYIGNSPNPQTLSVADRAQYFIDLERSEKKHACDPFTEDWYGMRDPLRKKRELRNPFSRQHEYFRSNLPLRALLCVLENSNKPFTNEDIRGLVPDKLWDKKL